MCAGSAAGRGAAAGGAKAGHSRGGSGRRQDGGRAVCEAVDAIYDDVSRVACAGMAVVIS